MTTEGLPKEIASYVDSVQPQAILNKLIRAAKARIKELETELADVTDVLQDSKTDNTCGLDAKEIFDLLIVKHTVTGGIYELKQLLKPL